MEYLSRKAEREQQQIEWRRSKVLEYQSMGLSQRETAEILKVGSGTVARDQIALREQAKENIANYMDHLPQDYQIALTGLTAIIRKAWVMVNEANNVRDKAIALNLLKDTIGMRFDLHTDSAVIEQAISFIDSKSNLPSRQVPDIKQSTKRQLQQEEEEDVSTVDNDNDNDVGRSEESLTPPIDNELISGINNNESVTVVEAAPNVHKPSTKIKTFAVKEEPQSLTVSEYDIQRQQEYEEYRRVYGILDKEE